AAHRGWPSACRRPFCPWFRLADARQILPVAGIDLQDVPLVDEEGNVERKARLQGGGLHRPRDGIAAHTGIALRDPELDGVWHLGGDGAPVPEEDVGVCVLLEEVLPLAERLLADVHLIV